MWHVYMLRCGDGSLYTGIALDPQRRLKHHNGGRGSAYVRSRGTARLVYREPCATKGRALRREFEIKSWRRPEKLALIARGRTGRSKRARLETAA